MSAFSAGYFTPCEQSPGQDPPARGCSWGSWTSLDLRSLRGTTWQDRNRHSPGSLKLFPLRESHYFCRKVGATIGWEAEGFRDRIQWGRYWFVNQARGTAGSNRQDLELLPLPLLRCPHFGFTLKRALPSWWQCGCHRPDGLLVPASSVLSSSPIPHLGIECH